MSRKQVIFIIQILMKKSKKNILGVNKKHVYYFQVQGQLQISKSKYCLFVIWTPLGIKTEKIYRDDSFWKEFMVNKLKNFYFDCLLPEIIDPRYPRSMPIKNPTYILEAQKLNVEKRNTNKNINKSL